MNRVWDLGECTVKEVQASLPEDRDLAYTSVATVMKILEQKGFLASRKSDRAHTFRALVIREEYATVTLRHVSENIFQGDPGRWSSACSTILDSAGGARAHPAFRRRKLGALGK